MKNKISFILPDDSRHVWEASKDLKKCIETIELVASKGVLAQSIEIQVLPNGQTYQIGKDVKDLVSWHSCDLEIKVGSREDGQTPFEITYTRTKPKTTNRLKGTK